MKKLIPILSLALYAATMQNCSPRDEDSVAATTISKIDDSQDHLLMNKDSTKSPDGHLVPDPPVRDGDDWRTAPKESN